MPNGVKLRQNHYEYYPEYYISFFGACERLSKPHGRIGMLVPWSFMFNKSFQTSERISSEDVDFDFLAEFGYDIRLRLSEWLGRSVRSETASSANLGERSDGDVHQAPPKKMKKKQKFLESSFVESNRRSNEIYS